MRKLIVNSLLVVLTACGGYFAYFQFVSQNGLANRYSSINKRDEKAWPVKAVVVKRGNHEIFRTVFGEVNAPRTTQLSFQIAGCIKMVADSAKAGRTVKEGDLLAQLDNRQTKHEIISAHLEIDELTAKQAEIKNQISGLKKLQMLNEEQYVLAKASLERQEKLLGQGITSSKIIDETKQKVSETQSRMITNSNEQSSLNASLNTLQKQIAIAEEQSKSAALKLEHSNLIAPHDGIIDTSSLLEGACVSPAVSVASLVDTSETEIILELPLRTYNQLVKNRFLEQKVKIFSGEVRLGDASILHTMPTTDATTGRVKLVLELQNNHSLVAGQQVRARLMIEHLNDVVMLPISSLFANRYIYTIEKDRLKEIGVEPVHQNSESIFISDEIESGATVLTSHVSQAAPDLLVEILATKSN